MCVGFSLERPFDPAGPGTGVGLSAEQRHALVAAYEAGYFEVPRGVTQSELAGRLGIGGSALPKRLRRGTARLIERFAVAEPPGGG